MSKNSSCLPGCIGFIGVLVGGALFIIFLLFFIGFWGRREAIQGARDLNQKESRQRGLIFYTKGTVNLRSGPAKRFEVIRKSKDGERLELGNKTGEWYMVLGTSKPLFVHSSVVENEDQIWIREQKKRARKEVNEESHGTARFRKYVEENVSHLVQTLEVEGSTIFIRVKDPLAAQDRQRMKSFANNMARLLSEYQGVPNASCSIYFGDEFILRESYRKPY